MQDRTLPLAGRASLLALTLLLSAACVSGRETPPDGGSTDGGGGIPTGQGRVSGTLSLPAAGTFTVADPSQLPPAVVEAANQLLARRAAQKGGVISAPPSSSLPAPRPDGAYVPGQVILQLLGDGEAHLPRLDPKALGLGHLDLRLGQWAGPDMVVVEARDRASGAPLDAAATLALADHLASAPGVRGALPNYYRHTLLAPNDNAYQFQWHYQLIGMEAAWDQTTGDSGVVIAVVDDGVRPHPDINARLLPGYDMVSDAKNAGDGDGRDPDASGEPGGPTGQSSWHGLHVAGTVGASTNNTSGVAGVDWQAKILPVRALGVAGGTGADVMAATAWAAGLSVPGAPANPNPADVINMSLGGGPMTSAEQDLVNRITNQGTIIVVAAGNDDVDAGQSSMGGYDNVIVVGATDLRGDRAPYSNWGSVIDIMAPGGDLGADANSDGYSDGVLSTWYSNDGSEPQYVFLQGTSMASPHIAGIVGLMKALKPTLTTAEAESLLKSTANSAFTCAKGCGAGLVNVPKVLQALSGVNTSPAQLALSSDRLNIDQGAAGQLVAYNSGGQPLDYRAWLEGAYAGNLSLAPTAGTLSGGESAALKITVSRGSLADGSYRATLVVSGASQRVEATIIFTVGTPPPPDVGVVEVATVGYDANNNVIIGGETTTTAGAHYAYRLDSGPGTWFVVAVADRDQSGSLTDGDLTGFWKHMTQQETVTVLEGAEIAPVDFGLVPYGGGGTPTEPPCATLRQCWEDCGSDAACADACAISDACQTCWSDTVSPCMQQNNCGSGEGCVCVVCDVEVDSCFGPLTCSDPGQSLAGVSEPCSADADCDSPYTCDSSGLTSPGYCTRTCRFDSDCPGGACQGFDTNGDGSADYFECAATCDPNGPDTCTHPQFTCNAQVGVCWL